MAAPIWIIEISTGKIELFGGTSAPSGSLICDGTLYDGRTTTYNPLWKKIGTTYGGTGVSSFAVPSFNSGYDPDVPPISYVTSLPASPMDTQVVVLTDSLTSSNYTWQLRYNASSTHTDKWDFIGGSRFATAESGSLVTTSGVMVDLTSGPTLIPPRSGTYWLECTLVVQNQTVAASSADDLNIQILGTTSGSLIEDYIGTFPEVVTQRRWDAMRPTIYGPASVVAGETLKIQVMGSNTAFTKSWSSGRLAMIPIRLS